IDDASSSALLPSLPDGFTALDQFRLSIRAAQFNQLASFTLTEGQNRFAPQVAALYPFSTQGELGVPGDFLLNASLRFTATAIDASGARRTATGATAVVPATADGSIVETSQTADFPSVFVDAPMQALQNQQVHVQ